MTLELSALVTFNPPAVSPETPIDQLIDMLQAMGVQHWPVVDEERAVVGLVSETDIVRSAQLNMIAAASAREVGGGTDWRPTTVAEVMTTGVVAVDLDSPTRGALKLLLERGFAALPVTRDGRLTAMITAGDFLREYSYGELPGSREPIAKYAIPFEDTVEATATLDDALIAMYESGRKFVAVIRGECPIGVVSQRELAKARCRQSAAELAGAPETFSLLKLTADSVIFRPGMKICEAADLLLSRNREGGMLVNQANRMVGMITVQQILQSMLRGL